MMSWNQSGAEARGRAWWEVLLAAPATDTLPRRRGELDRLLAPRGVALHRAGSPRETIERIEAGGVDLAVLWTDAAGLYGLRTLEIIRSLTADLPCLLVTPDTSDLTLRRALQLQAYSVIRQPVDSRMLAELLVRILRKRS